MQNKGNPFYYSQADIFKEYLPDCREMDFPVFALIFSCIIFIS